MIPLTESVITRYVRDKKLKKKNKTSYSPKEYARKLLEKKTRNWEKSLYRLTLLSRYFEYLLENHAQLLSKQLWYSNMRADSITSLQLIFDSQVWWKNKSVGAMIGPYEVALAIKGTTYKKWWKDELKMIPPITLAELLGIDDKSLKLARSFINQSFH